MVELVLSTRGPDHVEALCNGLREAGFEITLPDGTAAPSR
jgi:hypothetical protein